MLLHTFAEIGSLLINAGHFLFSNYFPPLSISLHPPSNVPYLLVPPLTIRITNSFSSSLQMLLILLPSSYLQQMLCQIPLLLNIRGWRYALVSLFAASAVNYFCFKLRHSKDIRVKLLSLQPCLAPLCVF